MVENLDNPLNRTEFLVLSFDHRDASMTVVDNLGYSSRNGEDAVQDAKRFAADAQAQGLPLRYIVVRISTEAVFPPEAPI